MDYSSVEIGRQVCLLYPCVRHLTILPLPLSGSTGSNRWQLDSKIEKVTSLSPSRGTLTNKWVIKLKPMPLWQIINEKFTARLHKDKNAVFQFNKITVYFAGFRNTTCLFSTNYNYVIQTDFEIGNYRCFNWAFYVFGSVFSTLLFSVSDITIQFR